MQQPDFQNLIQSPAMLWHRTILCLFALSALALGGCAHVAHDPPQARRAHGISEYTLANGLKLLVGEDHRAPLVVTQIWYRVGGADEYGGITGISHILEHMMFKGTEKYPREAFTRTIKRYGGRDNAFTGRDYTAYYQVFEKSRLPVSFDLESDRMLNLILQQQDFEKEHDVVREERRLRVDDRPESKLYEHLHSIALDNSPYRQPVIGWMADIDDVGLADLERWYRQWYAPNNATLVVVGDVNPDEVFASAQEYFGAIPPRALPPRKQRNETRQEGERRTVLAIPAAQAHLAIGYRVPRVGTAAEQWHPYALMVLAEVLSGGRSSRFERKLVRGAAIAQHAGASYSPYSRHDGLFYVSAAPVVGVSAAQLERNIEREIKALHDELVSDEELAAVKAAIISEEVFSRDSIRHQAYLLGSFETVGVGWDELFELRGKIEAVTAGQVREVARRYLLRHNRSVAVLDPQPPAGKK